MPDLRRVVRQVAEGTVRLFEAHSLVPEQTWFARALCVRQVDNRLLFRAAALPGGVGPPACPLSNQVFRRASGCGGRRDMGHFITAASRGIEGMG